MEILRQTVEAEELKLRLRRTQDTHDELDALDRQKREAAEQARKQAHAEQLAQQQAEREAREQARREQRRRAIIQEVAHQALSDNVGAVLWAVYGNITAAEKAEALAAIEQRLSALDVEAIPKARLVEMAEAIRNEVYGAARQRKEAEEREAFAPVRQALQEAVRVRQEFQKEAAQAPAKLLGELVKALTPSPEEQARQRERQEAERREARKRRLTRDGLTYLGRELDAEGIQPGPERFTIWNRGKQELERRLTGEEDEATVEDLVDRVLERELRE